LVVLLYRLEEELPFFVVLNLMDPSLVLLELLGLAFEKLDCQMVARI
jgi:hypothetical protein